MRGCKLDCRIDKRIDDLAKIFNPIIRGWIMYYGRYHKSTLSRVLMHLDLCLACWAMSKYRRLRGHRRRARFWIHAIRRYFDLGHLAAADISSSEIVLHNGSRGQRNAFRWTNI